MNRSGAVAITDTLPPTVATQLARDRATAGQATTTVAPGGPSAPRGDNGKPTVHRAVTSAYPPITRRRLDPVALGELAARKQLPPP
jgi:hypothetical protein